MTQATAPLILIARLIWFIAGIIEALLILRFLFKALGAATAPFVEWVYAVTQPIVRPFFGIFPAPVIDGAVLEWATLLAFIVVLILASLLVSLVNIFRPVAE